MLQTVALDRRIFECTVRFPPSVILFALIDLFIIVKLPRHAMPHAVMYANNIFRSRFRDPPPRQSLSERPNSLHDILRYKI